ncbi:putative OBP32pep [Thalictrum thalictroides]|uniref:Putative OBP32pep n=1 Tax=Thalictrum thalictroides TaxID=46969 RepID=A0A7J6W4C4_THATH|nr:putative OBP32pep [Thalictrum thalictroides]
MADRSNLSFHDNKKNEHQNVFGLPVPAFFVQIPTRLENFLKSKFKKSANGERGINSGLLMEGGSHNSFAANLDKQMKAWKENPIWVDESPQIKVSVPKGSLCNLNVKVKVGLPPDAIFDIVIDPDNRRVFKNIKEVISRRVLVDEGSRQVVEVEQAALWRFLWWSGTISIHVLVDQNREDHSMKFKQVKTGFMKRFEGSWRVQPVFVDEQICFPFKPKTWEDYDRCTASKGRVASIVTLEQLIEPALVPPPPISWYLRGITTRTSEMLIYDLLVEAARIRGDFGALSSPQGTKLLQGAHEEGIIHETDIKERWLRHRRNWRRHKNSRKFQVR